MNLFVANLQEFLILSLMVEFCLQGVNLVKLILRDKEYEVKPGMTLLSALGKINVVPESVIATREGEMILDDEILNDGEVVRLIAVISGGSCCCEPSGSNPIANVEIASRRLAMTC